MRKKLTNKKKKELLSSKYILTFTKDHIIYTEEFRKKVVLELSNGKNILEIYKSCKTFKELQLEIDRYIEYYNNYRYQWELKK